jgi:hypothetical protein
MTCQKSPCAQWWSRAITSKSSGTKIIKSCIGKRYWPHLWVCHLPRGGPGDHCQYPADQVPLCTRLKRSAPWLQIRSRCQRALALLCAPRHRARHSLEEGSGVAMFPMAQSMQPARKCSGVATCPEALCAPPTRKGLWCCHVAQGTESVTPQERAPELPRASWL